MKSLCRRKTRRKYTDFYSEDDVYEPESPVPNLTIDNFDSKGLIINPEAPCLAITIDPDYVKDCNKPLKIRKFLVKSDIIRLRKITRTKFFFYTTKERFLEKQREWQSNNNIYEEMKNFFQFCFTQLNDIEGEAFRVMRQKYDQLQQLQNSRPSDERSRLELEHQKIYTEVVIVYKKFRYLLKLIDYFDNVSEEADNLKKLNELLKTDMNAFLCSVPNQHSTQEARQLTKYMDTLIKPYLGKRRYLDAEIWEKGYESIRRRIFNYTRHLTKIALLHHSFTIIQEEFMTVRALFLQPKVFRKKTDVIRVRSTFLESFAMKMLDDWEEKNYASETALKITAILPTVVKTLVDGGGRGTVAFTDHKGLMEQMEILQYKITNLLNELDSFVPELCKNVENQVRKNIKQEKDIAKQALVKQTRLKNLLNHYKSHYIKRNIVQQYTTLILKPRGKVKPTDNVSKKLVLHQK